MAGLVGLAALVAIAVNARTGPGSARIANPDVVGAPRPVEPLFGFDHWITVHQIGTVVMMVLLIGGFVLAWRRHPRHPILLMVLATTLFVWQDPIMNWAPFAVYNPELWHWPETWPLVSLAPTVEPFIVIGYATFYMAPYFPAIWILRRLQARRPPESFVWRHPLVSLALLILPIGLVFDAFLEIFLVRTQLYIYSQVMPFGSFAAGEWYQFPFIWETVMVTFVMIPAGVLLYRDDTGKVAGREARPAGAGIPEAAGAGHVPRDVRHHQPGVLRVRRRLRAHPRPPRPRRRSPARGPSPRSKVYDPNGFYEENGQPGPYFPGIWSGWQSAQSGRPDVEAPADGGRCAPDGG